MDEFAFVKKDYLLPTFHKNKSVNLYFRWTFQSREIICSFNFGNGTKTIFLFAVCLQLDL